MSDAVFCVSCYKPGTLVPEEIVQFTPIPYPLNRVAMTVSAACKYCVCSCWVLLLPSLNVFWKIIVVN